MSKVRLNFGLVMVVALAAVPAAQGGIVDSAAEYQLENSSTANAKDPGDRLRVGLPDNGYDDQIVWLFELEDMDSATAADVSLAYKREVSISPNGVQPTVALYVSNLTRGTAEATTTDYITPGDDPTPPGGWTLLQLDFATQSTTEATNIGLNTTGRATLLGVLNNIYTSGYSGGEYIAIAAVADTNGISGVDEGSDRYEFKDGAFSGAHYQLEVVPEPATMSLLAIGGLAGLLRRKR